MSNHNNAPAVAIELTLEQAQLLLKDSEAAVSQLLSLLQAASERETASREHLEKIAELLDLKSHLMKTCRKQLGE